MDIHLKQKMGGNIEIYKKQKGALNMRMFSNIIIGLAITIFLIGCDSKQLKKYKMGATIVCVKKHRFSANEGAIINSDNSMPSNEEHGTGPIVTGTDDGYRVNGVFYSEDNCAVVK